MKHFFVTFEDGTWIKVYGCKDIDSVKSYVARNYKDRIIKSIKETPCN